MHFAFGISWSREVILISHCRDCQFLTVRSVSLSGAFHSVGESPCGEASHCWELFIVRRFSCRELLNVVRFSLSGVVRRREVSMSGVLRFLLLLSMIPYTLRPTPLKFRRSFVIPSSYPLFEQHGYDTTMISYKWQRCYKIQHSELRFARQFSYFVC